MQDNQQKTVTTCKTHNQPLKYFCQDTTCRSKHILCQLCKQQQHRNHNCRLLDNLNNIIKHLDPLAPEMKAKYHPNQNILQLFNEYNQNNLQLRQLIDRSQMSIPLKIAPPFSFLNMMIQGKLGTYLQQNQQLKQTDLLHISSLIKFLEDDKIQCLQQIYQVVQSVVQRLGRSFKNWKIKIQNAFSQLYNELEKSQVKNWLEVYCQKYVLSGRQKITKQNMKAADNLRKGSKYKNIFQQQLKQAQPFQIQTSLKKHLDQMLQQIFKQKQIHIEQKQKPYSVIIPEPKLVQKQKQKQKQKTANLLQKPKTKPTNIEMKPTQNQNQIKPPQNQNKIKPPQNQNQIKSPQKPIIPLQKSSSFSQKSKIQKQPNYKRIVQSNQNITKPMTKSEIQDYLNKLIMNKNYTQNLRQFIIQGMNQFNVQHLKKLVSFFPNLTKFNYIWNFQQCGLQLQKQQVFFQKSRCFDKNPQDLKTNQQILNLYGKLPYLQNITINHIQLFAKGQLKILNKNIKYLTLGQYLQSWQEQYLPYSIQKYVLQLNNLITLNIFNIKKIDGYFMQNIIKKYNNTLKNLWLSQCIQFSDIFLSALRYSKLQSIIFDQIKRINHTIYIPETLKILIIDNCQFETKIPFTGLSKANKLTDFSIFDSIFKGVLNIGDKIIQQLASIVPFCNIEYLSVAQCKSVTNSALKYLQNMPKLKQLCIDNTNVCLWYLSKCDKLLPKIKKLGIVGLQIQSTFANQTIKQQKPLICTCMQQILQKSIKLQLLSLKFQQNLVHMDMKYFKNIKHVSISSTRNKKQYRSKSLKIFINSIKELGKNINIV